MSKALNSSSPEIPDSHSEGSERAGPTLTSAKILGELLRFNSHQPATALFRTAELSHILRSNQFPGEGTVLDFGCGDGHISYLLDSWSPGKRSWLGLDVDQEELKLAADRSFYQRVFNDVTAAQALAPASVDSVFSNSVLEHIDNLSPVLSSIAGWVKPGGQFIFSVPSEHFESFIPETGPVRRAVLGVQNRQEYIDRLNRRILHFRYLGPSEWDQLLGPLGFQRTHLSYYLTKSQLERWLTVADCTSGLLSRLSTGKRPIEIQRSLRLRGRTPAAPARAVGSIIARLGALGVFDSFQKNQEAGACALYSYRRIGAS